MASYQKAKRRNKQKERNVMKEKKKKKKERIIPTFKQRKRYIP